MNRHLSGVQQAAFGPEILQLMSGALEDACQSLRAAGAVLEDGPQGANAREMLARRIIELTAEGERDRERLRDLALAGFGQLQLANSLEPSDSTEVLTAVSCTHGSK